LDCAHYMKYEVCQVIRPLATRNSIHSVSSGSSKTKMAKLLQKALIATRRDLLLVREEGDRTLGTLVALQVFGLLD